MRSKLEGEADFGQVEKGLGKIINSVLDLVSKHAYGGNHSEVEMEIWHFREREVRTEDKCWRPLTY